MIAKELKEILLSIAIGNEEFFSYIASRVEIFDLEPQFWGCFPILNDKGILIDIRVLVPTIKDELTMRGNIHEFTHAYDLFGNLGQFYNQNLDAKREELAINKEQEYLRKLSYNSYFFK